MAGGWRDRFLGPAPWTLDPGPCILDVWVSDQRRAQRGSDEGLKR